VQRIGETKAAMERFSKPRAKADRAWRPGAVRNGGGGTKKNLQWQ
jgi:hypothetical protein